MMSERTRNNARNFLVGMILGAVALVLTLTMPGCSTVSGAASLIQGIGADVEDMAEGTRARMSRE